MNDLFFYNSENCDEVRQDLQMRNLQSVVRDRGVQLEERERQKQDSQRTEALWAHQWEQDRMAKERREEAEERDRAYKNRDRFDLYMYILRDCIL